MLEQNIQPALLVGKSRETGYRENDANPEQECGFVRQAPKKSGESPKHAVRDRLAADTEIDEAVA